MGEEVGEEDWAERRLVGLRWVVLWMLGPGDLRLRRRLGEVSGVGGERGAG